ncbi:hypothetical protein JCM11641_006989, partial [Rhodosporidiobolus odoratus]
IFAVSNAVMIPIIYRYCPEIASLSLEGIDALFVNGQVTMRRTTKVDIGGHAFGVPELGKENKGSFEHMEKVETGKY